MAFGERLQELRRARGMTQEDFAAQLKVSRQVGVLPGIPGA